MSLSYTYGDQNGKNVSMFFNNSIEEMWIQMDFCGKVYAGHEFEIIKNENMAIIDFVNVFYFYTNRVYI